MSCFPIGPLKQQELIKHDLKVSKFNLTANVNQLMSMSHQIIPKNRKKWLIQLHCKHVISNPSRLNISPLVIPRPRWIDTAHCRPSHCSQPSPPTARRCLRMNAGWAASERKGCGVHVKSLREWYHWGHALPKSSYDEKIQRDLTVCHGRQQVL